MIPCHICGKDASTGWIRGFVPAPDSQKMALCPGHNTQENRLAVAKAWQQMLRGQIADLNDVARQKAGTSEQMLSVHFNGGGMLSFLCTACEATEHGSLKVQSPDGALTFIPLNHIRDYSLRPISTAGKTPPARVDDEAATGLLRQEPAPLLPGHDSGAAQAKASPAQGPAPERGPDAKAEGFFFNKADTSFAAALPFSGKKDPA